MSKIIKPLLNADGTQWITPIYYEEKWKPEQNEQYYFRNLHYDKADTREYTDYTFDNVNIAIGNCFRTREEAEQADIQVILDNLKTYYKNKEGK